MESNVMQKVEQVGQSITLKAVIIGFLTLLMLIPGAMIQSLVHERQERSRETVQKINEQWSLSQMLSGPYLVVPYRTFPEDRKMGVEPDEHEMICTPTNLNIKVQLMPELRHKGIFTSILYRSKIAVSGTFRKPDLKLPSNSQVDWSAAIVRIGISDLRGMKNIPDFRWGKAHIATEAGGSKDAIGEGITGQLRGLETLSAGEEMSFACDIELNGSSELSFVPAGRETRVSVNGNWASPGFTGSFLPDYRLDKSSFTANWRVLHFNRNIPPMWTDGQEPALKESAFGISLVNPVDHYQQNMRSAKYAIMFVVLTFVIFFFVEVLTGKRIHPIQYLLVGVSLILFYTLLLSLSEQIGFGAAYLIAAVAIVGLISSYAHSIFRKLAHSASLAAFLSMLYLFLYIVLQLEDIALLIGSIGLFLILGIIMYVSRRISWYKGS